LVGKVWDDCDCLSQGYGAGFASSLNDVVLVFSGKEFDVQGDAGVDCESAEEFGSKFSVKIAHLPINGKFNESTASPAQVNGAQNQRFVHRHYSAPEPLHSLPLSQGFVNGLTEDDASIFNGVVVVNVGIAASPNRRIKPSVPQKGVEHVVKEADASVNLDFASPVKVQLHANLRLGSLPLNFRCPRHFHHRTNFSKCGASSEW
jgi:hypothetical protein